MEVMPGNNIVNSVIKTLNLVELLDACGEMGVTEIARKMGYEKSMVYRMLSTLKSRHYVRQNPVNLKYSNAYKFYELGQGVLHEAGLSKMAHQFMQELAEAAPGGSINLAVQEGFEAVYIEKIESAATITVSMKTGQSILLYCSSVGKALMMFQPREKLKRIIGAFHFEKFTPQTIEGPESLLADLEGAERRGFAVDSEEHLPGICCVAAPVFDSRGRTVAALGIASPAMLMDGRQNFQNLGAAVTKAAADFTDYLGGCPAGLAASLSS